jgi:hypothetical protein
MNVADYRTYCRTFKRGSIDSVRKPLYELNAQCFHMGKKRTKEVASKVNLDRIKTMSAWVVSNMDDLLKSFTGDFRAKLRPEWDGLVAQHLIVRVGPIGPPTACSVPSIIATGPTGPGEIIQFDTAPKT